MSEYTGNQNIEERNLVVQKSNPLLSLWQSDLTLAEFKILDAYLAKIDSHMPQKREVLFEKNELEKLLNVQKINLSSLKKRLRHLLTGVVEIRDANIERGFVLISLFERAFAEQDVETGVWQVRLKCTEDAMTYIFNIENLGYLRYKLSSVVNLRSRYSYIMFLYIERNRYRKTWTEELQKIREMLNCNSQAYEDFKRFNDLILKKSFEEITQKTKCKYHYSTVRKGRNVTQIVFSIEEINNIECPALSTDEDDLIKLVAPGLADTTYRRLNELLNTVPDALLPWAEDEHTQRINYLRIKYRMIMSNRDRITHKDAYLIKVIENDIKTSSGKAEINCRKHDLLPSVFD